MKKLKDNCSFSSHVNIILNILNKLKELHIDTKFKKNIQGSELSLFYEIIFTFYVSIK